MTEPSPFRVFLYGLLRGAQAVDKGAVDVLIRRRSTPSNPARVQLAPGVYGRLIDYSAERQAYRVSVSLQTVAWDRIQKAAGL